MMNEKFLEAMPIVKHLESHGYATYFVGGAVRDELLGKTIGDIDIATEARPDEVTSLFEKVIPVGIDHGTVMVRYEGESYEVTTFRVDGEYNDLRHPDEVEYVSTIEEDLSRRDFTMNAIAMDQNGNLIDPFEGKKDIIHHNIRTVGSPHERFQEDPLRMMRAIRFVSQHGFELSDKTYNAFDKWKHLLGHIAIERIAVEFEKLFQGQNIHKAWSLLRESRLYAHLPVLKSSHALLEETKNVHWVPLCDLAEVISVFHLLNTSTPIHTWVKEWKLSNRIKRKSLLIVHARSLWQKGEEKRALYHLGEEHLDAFYRILETIDEAPLNGISHVHYTYKALPIHVRQDLEVDGNDLKSLFPDRKPGPWIKDYMDNVEALIINGELNNRFSDIKERVVSWNPHERN